MDDIDKVLKPKLVASIDSIESMDCDDLADEIMDENENEPQEGAFQNQNKLLDFLPYASVIPEEADAQFERLKLNLAKAIVAKDYNIGIYTYTRSLTAYLSNYGYRFTKPDHISLVNLFYELLTMEECPLTMVNTIGVVYVRLIRKCHLLKSQDIVLAWRPLYDAYDRHILHRKYILSSQVNKSIETTLKKAIILSAKYFPSDSLKEIIEFFSPNLCPSTNKMQPCLEMLKIFLPFRLHSCKEELNKFQEFLLEIYAVWNNSPSWEPTMFSVLSFCSWKRIGSFDWNPYLPLMYSRLMKGLCLPVYFKGVRNSQADTSKSFDMAHAAQWVIGTLGNNPEAIRNLKNFLETLETYYNPSNIGRWSNPLATFLNELVNAFTVRLKRERYTIPRKKWWCDIEKEKHLTEDDIDEFVGMTSELVIDFFLDPVSNGFLIKNLAIMRPYKIIPAIMEKYDQLVENLNEPRKYLTCLRWVTITLLPLASSRMDEDNYDGRSLIIPFALSLLPTITCNDMLKTLTSLGAIHGIFNLVPLVDCSSLASKVEDENEQQICSETSCLEDFCLQFLDSLLSLIESKTQEHTRLDRTSISMASAEDLGLEKMLWAVCNRLAEQSSTKLFLSSAKKITSFLFERTLETDVSGRLFGTICQAVTVAKPDIMLPKLLPRLCASIDSLITDDMVEEENMDKTLQFHLLVFAFILETNGQELIKYRTHIETTLKSVLKLKSKKGYSYTCSILQKALNTLVLIYPLGNKISEADFDSETYLAIKDWGLTMDKKDIHVQWHVPSEEELLWAKDIFFSVFREASATFEGIDKRTAKCDKLHKVILKDLCILHFALDGIHTVVPFWNNVPVKLDDTVIEFTPKYFDFGLPQIDFTIPGTNGKNVKEKYFEIYCSVKTYLDKFKDDDTDAYIQLVRGLDLLVFAYPNCGGRYIPHTKLGNSLQNHLHPKRKSTRAATISRIFDTHMKRLRQAGTLTWSDCHNKIMTKLFEFTVNRYARVRAIAQGRFCHMVETVGPLIMGNITHLFIEKLKEGVPHDEYKGVLYTLLTCKVSPIMINTFGKLSELWLALLHSPFSEKNSIIRCMDSVRRTLLQQFIFFPLEQKMSLTAIKTIKAMLNEEEQSVLETTTLDTSSNYKLFDNLVAQLLTSAKDSNNHWRKRVLATSMLSLLIIEELPLSKEVVEFFYDALVSSSVDIRSTALSTVAWLCVMFKLNFDKVEVDTRTGIKLAPGETIHSVLQYSKNPNDEAIPSGRMVVTDTKGQLVQCFRVHKPSYGYASLPAILEVKQPPNDYSDFSQQSPSVQTVLEVINRYFRNPEYVKQLFNVFSQEEKTKGTSNKRTTIFVILARSCGPNSLAQTLNVITELSTEKDQWKQRCLADACCGIIYGMKNWKTEEIDSFWLIFKPILNKSLDNVTQETLAYWCKSLIIPNASRDPNSMRYFIELMKERWINSLATIESTSVESFKDMNFFDDCLANLHWKGAQVYQEIFDVVQKYFIDSPIAYVNCRFQLGRLMGNTLEWSGDQPVSLGIQISPKFAPFVESVMDRMKDIIPAAAKFLANDKDSMVNTETRKLLLIFKSVMELISTLCWDAEKSIEPIMYKFIPLCCHFESFDPDPEVATLAATALSGLAQSLVLPKNVLYVVNQVAQAAQSPSWKSRLSSVEFLKVFTLNNTNIFASSEEFGTSIMNLVLNLLVDPKLEVRELAANVLSGFLHSLICRNPDQLLEQFQKQAKIFSKKRQASLKKEPKVPLTLDEICKGHSAILGLCAFVDTYPYDVPTFLPNILITLSNHVHMDPQPIPATIKKCLSNFRRTHHDNWAVHKTKFTEDQLCILTDIFVSPCYYA